VSGDRLNARLQQLGSIGRGADGVLYRPAYGPAHAEAVALVAGWLREAGIEPGLDATGNLIGVLPGREPNAPAVALGSHLDTVPDAGIFDGALGVLAALEVLQTLREAGRVPRRPLCLIGFADEEGNNFGVGVLSAQLWIGDIPPERYPELRDRSGRGLDAYLADFVVPGVPRVERPALAAYLELHVEQGPVLDRDGGVAAAVTGIVGISRTTVRFTGEANHSGTTPTALRKDALLGAAELALAVRAVVDATGAKAVGTVGVFEVSPGATNVIPGAAQLRIEYRTPNEDLMRALRADTEARAAAIAARHGLSLAIDPWHHSPAVPMHPLTLQATEVALGDAGLPRRSLPSWAGHDAKVLARRIPTGMLFVPSQGGFSHSPREATDPAHCAAGTEALLHAAWRLTEDPALDDAAVHADAAAQADASSRAG
jgi:hydantoinase/carbamoylase family amidase